MSKPAPCHCPDPKIIMPQIIEKKTLHSGYLEVLALRLRLPGGEEIAREVADYGRSVAVLPYDPARRVALLIRLLRAPVLLSTGAAELLEAPAGMVEEDDPEDTAARELEEEVGLKVARLDRVGSVFTSPGVSTERMDLFLAAYAEADRIGAGGGVADEHENITVSEMPLDTLWAMVERNEIADMKTLALLLALKVRQPLLFGGA
jgi:nudix-type nucleoside diphosphatase (YffH/AdpP family)